MPAPDRPASFPFYPLEFLGDEHVRAFDRLPGQGRHVALAGYLRLLCFAWVEPEPGKIRVPDESRLANLSGLDELWPKYREAIARCFEIRGDLWVQKRMSRERELQLKRYERAAESGRKGGRQRARNERLSKGGSSAPHATASESNPIAVPGPVPGPAPAPGPTVPPHPEKIGRAKTELSAERPLVATSGTAGFQPGRRHGGDLFEAGLVNRLEGQYGRVVDVHFWVEWVRDFASRKPVRNPNGLLVRKVRELARMSEVRR